MSSLMKASDFVEKLKNIALNHKTLYVMGCFGAPMTAKNKKRYSDNNDYNRNAARTKMINAASADTFGFDCVCLIKGVLWGWNADTTKVYGGAQYKSNGVPDTNADGMIALCTDVSTDFSDIKVGEVVWQKGHVGVYIGNGLAVESTPAWKNKVQITAVGNIGAKTGYNTRKWTKHGKLPFIAYSSTSALGKPTTPISKPATKPKVDAALKKDYSLTGSYKTTYKTGLNLRTGASANKTKLAVLPYGTVVRNYGYYNVASNGVKWLYVVAPDGTIGYCSSTYLKKC